MKRNQQTTRAERQRAAGLCVRCDAPSPKGLLCEKHRQIQTEARRKSDANRRKLARENGLCYCCCANKAEPGFTSCRECRKSDRVPGQRCGACREPGHQRSRCPKVAQGEAVMDRQESHRKRSIEAMAKLRARRKEAGLCVHCESPARPGRVTCALHWKG